MTTDELWAKYDSAREKSGSGRSIESKSDVRNWRPPERFNPRSPHDISCAERAAANFYFADNFWSKERFGIWSTVKGVTLCKLIREKKLGCKEVCRPGDPVDPHDWTEECMDDWDWENRQKLYDKYRRTGPVHLWGVEMYHHRNPWPSL